MKRMITFTKEDFEAAYSHLLRGEDEEAAFFIGGLSQTAERLNLLVREVIPVSEEGFIKKGRAHLTIAPEFMAPIIKRARLDNLCVISAHSHPFSDGGSAFSFIDDYGDDLLMPKIQGRVPNRPHATMVFGRSSLDARVWELGKMESVKVDAVRVIGETIRDIIPTNARQSDSEELGAMHNRQILAFGELGQKKIHSTKVAVVGLGGIGSLVLQQLVHLGVRELIIVDDDVVEESNRSRIVGSRPEDSVKRRSKVEVMERLGHEINPSIKTRTIKDSVNNINATLALRDADVIFCCTDNLSSRLVLNRFASQYFIPVIDMGIDIQAKEEGKIRTAGGRVTVLLPDLPCLSCMGLLNPQALAAETSDQGYVSGMNITNPSVISLDGVVASLAVTEFVNLLTGFERRKQPSTYQVYDVLQGAIWRESMEAPEKCGVCGEVKGLGDNVELPCRASTRRAE